MRCLCRPAVLDFWHVHILSCSATDWQPLVYAWQPQHDHARPLPETSGRRCSLETHVRRRRAPLHAVLPSFPWLADATACSSTHVHPIHVLTRQQVSYFRWTRSVWSVVPPPCGRISAYQARSSTKRLPLSFSSSSLYFCKAGATAVCPGMAQHARAQHVPRDTASSEDVVGHSILGLG